MRLFFLFLTYLFLTSAGDSERVTAVQLTPDNSTEIVCFIYHRVGDHRYPSTNTSPKDFEAHLAYLSKNNFTVLNFSDALKYLQSGESGKKVAVITVDDAFTSFFKNGLPLLKKYNFPATLFINTKTVGGGDYMSWDDLRVAMKAGVEIGNHTHSHDFFMNLPEAKRYQVFRDEIELSQQIISKNLDIEPGIFSYPYGEFDPRMKDIVKSFGFKAAAAQKSGVWYNGMDVFQMPRFPMSESYSAIDKFKEKANMRALRVSSVSPESFVKPQSDQPPLTISFDPDGLRLDQMQCFIQGSPCDLKIVDRGKATVTIRPTQSIAKKRRTIYTVTVPDKKGKWHWYSHLWINASVADHE
jgi:peptidoglycan/xylan/chitin deacetylase (PgdA/CDA1 family)